MTDKMFLRPDEIPSRALIWTISSTAFFGVTSLKRKGF